MSPFMSDVDVETTPYSVNLVISKLGKLSTVLNYLEFDDNYMKINSDKSHSCMKTRK